MQMSPPASHLQSLAQWASSIGYHDIPAETCRAARYQVLNMIAAARAGAASLEAASIGRALASFSTGEGRSTVAGLRERRGPADATLANCAYAIAQDFDDIVWIGHTCHSAVFASLAVAEHEQLDGESLVTAVVVANEIAGRVGASCFLGPLNGQMTSFIHLIGAAAATAKLLHLDADRTAHAMAIALMQPGFVLQPGFMRPSSKLLAAASPAATGVQAAYFAREGMTGDLRILEDRRGLWSRFSFLPLPLTLGDLGQFWVMQTLSMKTHPGCHYFQTACEAIDAIVARRGQLTLDRVAAVELATTILGQEATRFAAEYAVAHEPPSPVNINFDLGWTAAVMLHAERLTSAEMQPDWLAEHSPALRQWYDRIHIRHDPALTAKVIASGRSVAAGRRAWHEIHVKGLLQLLRRYRAEYDSPPMPLRDVVHLVVSLWQQPPPQTGIVNERQHVPLYFPNRVTIRFTDGTSDEEQIDLPAGSFPSVSAEAALHKKFLQVMTPSMGSSAAQAAFSAGLHLEELPLSEFIARSGLGETGDGVAASVALS